MAKKSLLCPHIIAKEQNSVQFGINTEYNHQQAMDDAQGDEAARKTLRDTGFNVSPPLLLSLLIGRFTSLRPYLIAVIVDTCNIHYPNLASRCHPRNLRTRPHRTLPRAPRRPTTPERKRKISAQEIRHESKRPTRRTRSRQENPSSRAYR